MKKIIIFATLCFYSVTALSGETLSDGNYICKKGFLGFFRVDSLAINSLQDGSLQIDMDDRSYNISKDCQVTNSNVDKIEANCDKASNKLILSQKFKAYKESVTTSLSFEKIKGIVIVKEGEKSTHSNREIILICRPIN